MIEMRIDVRDYIGPELKRFGADADRVTMTALKALANKYRGYVRKSYLSGQMLGKRTGKTYNKMRYVAVNRDLKVIISGAPQVANIYEHPGGVTIKPKNKKVLHFIAPDGNEVFTRWPVWLAPKPFMTDSFRSFNFAREFPPFVDQAFHKELVRRGLA